MVQNYFINELFANKVKYSLSILFKGFLFAIVFNLYGCHCKTCIDNLTEANKLIPYKDKDVVIFLNDTLGYTNDTLNVQLGSISKGKYDCYNTIGDEQAYYCSSSSEISYNECNFLIRINQLPNRNLNKITNQPLPEPINKNIINKTDTIMYDFKNEQILVFRYHFVNDKYGSVLWKNYPYKNGDSSYIYNDYYYTTDKTIKLLQYTRVYKDGKRRVFRLKE